MYAQAHVCKHFPLNPQGRDFVAGDIHGCFDRLDAELTRLAFDPARDRLFAVGDLIDRGPDSARALEWLRKPWFHACLGNHEEMILTVAPDSDEGRRWYGSYGGDWWLTLPETRRGDYLEAFGRLPFAMEVETAQGRVGLVHADIPRGMDWPEFLRRLGQGDMEARSTALWGRSRIKRLFGGAVRGIDRVVCGHTVTPDRRIVIKGNVWFIETGAFLRDDPDAGLTLLSTAQLFE